MIFPRWRRRVSAAAGPHKIHSHGKPRAADQRESPARPIARKLRARGADVAYHDPYVPSWPVDGKDVPRSPAAAHIESL